jgi:hypothetical protein
MPVGRAVLLCAAAHMRILRKNAAAIRRSTLLIFIEVSHFWAQNS